MKKRRPTWIPVVAGLIRKNNQFLVGLRPAGGGMATVWEFPGGKIEPGEDPAKALCRELMEELGIEAQIGELQFVTSHQYGDTNILLIFFDVMYWKGEPKPIHHETLKWVTLSELAKLDLPDANRTILPRIREVLP
jgi:8-oxo-dGTP diphosphatase